MASFQDEGRSAELKISLKICRIVCNCSFDRRLRNFGDMASAPGDVGRIFFKAVISSESVNGASKSGSPLLKSTKTG